MNRLVSSTRTRPGRLRLTALLSTLVAFGEPVHLDIPADVKGKARQAAALEQVATALRNQLSATLATTDLVLPLDDPLRQRRANTEAP